MDRQGGGDAYVDLDRVVIATAVPLAKEEGDVVLANRNVERTLHAIRYSDDTQSVNHHHVRL